MLHNLTKFFLLLFIPLVIISCKDDKNKAEVNGLGNPFINALYPYPIYVLNGELNLDYTQTCGSATADTDGTTGGTGTSTATNRYKIAAFYMIDLAKFSFSVNGQSVPFPLATAVINTRFKYDTTQSKFSLNPGNTVFTTCKTIDFINCDAAGTLSCETVDNIKCGGNESFIFTSTSNYQAGNLLNLAPFNIAFQAYAGTVDWSNGFTLSANNSQVDYSDIEFNMVARDNSVFTGRIRCRRPAY